MTIEEMQKEAYATAKANGFHESERNVPECLMLIVSEVSEAVEDFRNGDITTKLIGDENKPCGFPTELADAVIRIADTAEMLGIDLGTEIRNKMNYNKTRSYRHGGKLA